MKAKKRPWGFFRCLVVVLVFAGAFLLSACATIFTGTTDSITFDSEMGPLRVFIDGEYIGETPVTTTVKRKLGNTKPLVRFEKDGFVTQEYPLKKSFNWIAISDISSLILSGGIDLLTGAIMEYDPLHYNIVLLPEDGNKQGAYKRKIRVNFFVIATFDSLMRDLTVGQGEYFELLPDVTLTQFSHKEYFHALLFKNRKELLKSANGLIFIQNMNRLMIEDPVLNKDRLDLDYWNPIG